MVGAGTIVRDRHIPGLRAQPDVELVGVVNRTAESSQVAARALGFRKTYAHWRELIADPAVDAVVIGTWPSLHAPITIAALTAGKHVLTQARMAMNATEARAMLDASLRHPNLTAMVAPVPFSFWCDRTLARLIAEQAVGALRTVRVFWSNVSEQGAEGRWRHDPELSGNNVMYLAAVYEAIARWIGHAVAVQAMTHVFDPVRSGPGWNARGVTVPDHVAVLAEFAGSVFLTLEMSAHARFEANGALLFGDRGTLRVNFSAQRLEIATDASPPWRPVEIPQHEQGSWRVEEEFIAAIRGEGVVTLTDFPSGVRYMAFADAVAESAKRGVRIWL